MGLLNELIELDKELLLFFNAMHSPFWDSFFWQVTQTMTWLPFYITIIYIIVKSQKAASIITIISIIIVIVLCDQISTNIFKDGFKRLRPTHDQSIKDMVHLVGAYRGGMYGFVSSHAANSFALATFVSLLFRNWFLSLTILCWAIFNSYSRIYLGVHYPGDIIGGLILGVFVAFLVHFVYLRVFPWFIFMPHNTKLALQKEIALKFKSYYPGVIAFSVVIIFSVLLIASKYFLKLI
ncbi:MAG: phosphatase PAP2 family protein [Marinilabiliaceae bacterium]|nr:phosphatase PAP2 family protein [Marinilabiliaceae bacterium]